MKNSIGRNDASLKPAVPLARVLVVAGFLFGAANVLAQMPPGGGWNAPTNLDSWGFSNTNTWVSDLNDAPVSFTNLSSSLLGDGAALVIDSTNPAWLQFNVSDSTVTNLTLPEGSVALWVAPRWASTNAGGFGPDQQYGRLLDIGTGNLADGFFSLYFDPAGDNVYFTTATNSSPSVTCLTAPISWTTNRWHQIVLTYSATNGTALYIDGTLATNGPSLTVWPGPDVLANGLFFGSDAGTGVAQAHAMLDDIATYSYPLDAGTISNLFSSQEFPFYMNPANYANLSSAPSQPSPSPDYFNAVTGQGNLLYVGPASGSSYGANSNDVWITDVMAATQTNGLMAIRFTVDGGADNTLYDVFANSVLDFSANTNRAWAWEGQAVRATTYELDDMPPTACFLILGTPVDSDKDGLTDAYEQLVSKTDPNNPYSNLDGILDGWDVALGLSAQDSNTTDPAERANYDYTLADWLYGVSGVKSGSINLDNEGNALSVSQ